MGVDYYPKNKKIKKLLLNFSGADLLGLLSLAAGIRSWRAPEGADQYFWRRLGKRAPYKRSAEEAKEDAKKIRSLKPERILRIAKKHSRLLEDPEDLIEFAEEWAQFLEKCEGYKVPE